MSLVAYIKTPVLHALAACIAIMAFGTALPAQAADAAADAVADAASGPVETTTVDLILSPALELSDAPFYRGASIKIGARIVPITEGTVSGTSLAQYDPAKDIVVVSNASGASEIAKGEALMDVMAALQVNDIATAAGR